MARATLLLQAGICAAAHLFVFLSWFAFLRAYAAPVTAPVRWLLSFTLLWVHVIVSVLALGLFGSLTRINVVFLTLGAAAVVLAAALFPATRVHARASSNTGTPAGRRSVIAVSVAIVAAAAFAWYTMLAVFFPPIGYDDLAYRIPGAAFALQHGALVTVDLPPRLVFVNYYPQAAEFLSIWCFALVGSDAMISVWQVGVFLHFVAGCAVLCWACGCGRAATLFGVGLAAMTPTLLAQLLTTYNDLFVAALFASALAFAVVAGRDRGPTALVGLALSCGCLLAAKLSAPFLAAVALLVFVWHAVRTGPVWSHLIRPLLFVATTAAALGGYWYVRNALLYGNPIYPFKVDVAGIHLPGQFSASLWSSALLNPELSRLPLFERLWRLWLEQKSHYGFWFYGYDSAFGGFGPAWFVLGLPSIVTGTILCAVRRRWRTFAVLATTAVAYLTFGGNISVRYTLFVLPAMALGIALLVDDLEARTAGPAGPPAVIARLGVRMVQVVGLVLAVVTAGLMAFAVKSPDIIRRQVFTSTVAKVDVASPVLDAFRAVRTLLPARSTVIFDESVEFIYPLWRPDFANRVHFVSTAQSLEAWWAAAAALKAQYLFANLEGTSRTPVSPLHAWIASHPDRFRLVATVPNHGMLYELF